MTNASIMIKLLLSCLLLLNLNVVHSNLSLNSNDDSDLKIPCLFKSLCHIIFEKSFESVLLWLSKFY